MGTNLVGDAVGMAGTMGAGLTIGDSVNVMGAKGVNVCFTGGVGVGAEDVVCATTMSTGDMFDIAKNTRITHFDTIPSLHCRYGWIMLPFCHDIKIM